MKKPSLFWQCIFVGLIGPVLACGPIAGYQVTPTPTKTPKRIEISPQLPPVTPTVVLLPTTSTTSELVTVDSPTPIPQADTPTPALPPTDTPTPPPPPPTNTPAPPPSTPTPPPPTNTPAPPPPTQPPANQGPQVIIELPKGNTFDRNDQVKVVIIVRDPDGVTSFTWGVAAQNQALLPVGGDKACNGAAECRTEEEFDASVPSGTYIIGADAVDTKGATTRGVGEIYVR